MAIVQVIPARERDLGGFVVRRVLPFESRDSPWAGESTCARIRILHWPP